MINILIPLGGKPSFFENLSEYPFPKPLIEVLGRPMIQWVIENYQTIGEDVQFVFVINKADCDKFHLDEVLKLLTNELCQISILPGETMGAACSCLFAIDHINNEDPLIIANGDQLISQDLNIVYQDFVDRRLDCGVISFNAVHPKWSYARVNDIGDVIETAEKRPISKNAIAGFYYFSKGSIFVEAAKNSIRKCASVEDKFYVAPVINEIILNGGKVGLFSIENSLYHSFYSPRKIQDFESERKDFRV